LDQIVFSTIISFPTSEQAAAEQLWQGVRLMNEVPLEEEEVFKKALLPIYLQSKRSYEKYEEDKKK